MAGPWTSARDRYKSPRREGNHFPPRLDRWEHWPSLGPTAVSAAILAGSRTLVRSAAAARLPSPFVEGLRALVPTYPSPRPLLWTGLSGEGPSLAMLAGGAALPGQQARPRAAACPEPSLSAACAPTASHSDCYHRYDCYRRQSSCPGHGTTRGQRGPAPKPRSAGFAATTLRPARLLRTVRAGAALSDAAFLFVPVPLGFTSRPATRVAAPRAAATRPATATVTVAVAAVTQPFVSSTIFPHVRPR